MNEKTIAAIAEGFGPVIRAFISKAIGPLVARVDAIEKGLDLTKPMTIADAHRGAWTEGTVYRRGDLATFDGSMWLVRAADTTAARPGTNGDWLLVVKRGRDGKDAGR